jgi:hypothetical protein
VQFYRSAAVFQLVGFFYSGKRKFAFLRIGTKPTLSS